jgi:hypothetical protein
LVVNYRSMMEGTELEFYIKKLLLKCRICGRLLWPGSFPTCFTAERLNLFAGFVVCVL